MPPRNAAKRQNCCAATRKVTPRAAEGFNWIARGCCLCVLHRGLQNLDAPLKGFNCCGAKLWLRCADSRFAEPRCSLQRGRFYVLFASCKKNQKARQRFANLWTPGTIQSSVGSNFVENSGGSCRNRFCPQNGGEKALNRCERVTAVQTQDRCFSKKRYCTASSQ